MKKYILLFSVFFFIGCNEQVEDLTPQDVNSKGEESSDSSFLEVDTTYVIIKDTLKVSF